MGAQAVVETQFKIDLCMMNDMKCINMDKTRVKTV